MQLVTTLHKLLLHTDRFSQAHCSLTASNGGRSSASGITSWQAGDHLTPTSYLDSMPTADSLGLEREVESRRVDKSEKSWEK
jgi:hypothetical protein